MAAGVARKVTANAPAKATAIRTGRVIPPRPRRTSSIRSRRRCWRMVPIPLPYLPPPQPSNVPLVAVVVLSHDGREDALTCLASLARVRWSRLAVILVDNGSEDGTAEAVAA